MTDWVYESSSEPPNSTMDEEAAEFVEAVQNDEYAEYELEPGFTLVTDWEGDGSFEPYVVLPDDFDDNGKATNLIDEEAGHFMDFDDLELSHNRITFAHLYGAELTVE